MRTRTKVLLSFSVIMIILVGIAFIKVPQVYEFFDKSTMGDGNGGTTGNGDDSGSLEAKTSLYIYDESGNIQKVAWMASFAPVVGQPWDLEGVDIEDFIAACEAKPGFHWEGTRCVANVEAPDDADDPITPDIEFIPVEGDFDKYMFVLEWAEIEGYKINKNSVYMWVKAGFLLKDDTWSGPIGRFSLRYANGDFRDIESSGDYFKIRCDESTMSRNSITVERDEILDEASISEIASPLKIRFYFYAKGTPTAGGDELESHTINKVLVVEGDLGASLGVSGLLMIAPIVTMCIQRRSFHESQI